MSCDCASTVKLVDANLETPQFVEVAGGHGCVFSARAPEKTGANEDGAAVFQVADDRAVLVVADGMGGQPGGHSASRIVLDCVERSLEAPEVARGSLRVAILDAVERANDEVRELGIGAATTLAAVEIAGDMLRPYHVGDSSILVVGQRGKIKLLTVAHSPVGYAVESGMLDEQEALYHDERHLVSNMVGHADMRIEVGSPLRLAPRDTVVLGTDGLFDNMGLDELVDRVRSRPTRSVCCEIAELCSERMRGQSEDVPSKPDDLSFVVFRPRAAGTTDRPPA